MPTTASDDRGPIRPLADIDLAGITEALGDGSGETTRWYDPATGGVEIDLPDWDTPDEDRAENDPSERGLIPIEPIGSRAAYRDMVDFAESVADTRASGPLRQTLEGRGAFRRFRDTLYAFPELSGHWRDFSDTTAELRAIDWLIGEDLVDLTDADIERAMRVTRRTAALAAIGASTGEVFDDAEVPGRWDEIRAAIDAGRAVTIVREGHPWAIVSP